MTSKLKKICLVFASGTALTSVKRKTVVFVDREADISQWLSEIPEISIIAQIEPYFFHSESEFFPESKSLELAKFIYDQRQSYDGFVVLTSADTTIRQSVLTSFMLQSVKVPIIFTGAPFTLRALTEGKLNLATKKFSGFGLKSNVINAVQVATRDFERVAIMYGNRLLDPIKTIRTGLADLNIFSSIDGDYLGKVEFSIRLDERKRQKQAGEAVATLAFSSEVMMLDSFRLASLDSINLRQTKILIVRIPDNQSLTPEMVRRLAALRPLVVIYNFWYVLDQGGLPRISSITEDALLMKCSWLAGQSDNKKTLLKGLGNSYLGEEVVK